MPSGGTRQRLSLRGAAAGYIAGSIGHQAATRQSRKRHDTGLLRRKSFAFFFVRACVRVHLSSPAREKENKDINLLPFSAGANPLPSGETRQRLSLRGAAAGYIAGSISHQAATRQSREKAGRVLDCFVALRLLAMTGRAGSRIASPLNLSPFSLSGQARRVCRISEKSGVPLTENPLFLCTKAAGRQSKDYCARTLILPAFFALRIFSPPLFRPADAGTRIPCRARKPPPRQRYAVRTAYTYYIILRRENCQVKPHMPPRAAPVNRMRPHKKKAKENGPPRFPGKAR